MAETPKGSQRKASSFRLVISRGETQGKIFILHDGPNLIGRWDPDAGAFPEVDLENHDPEAKVSRRHAVLDVDSEGITVEDLGSMNGTFVNRGKRLETGIRQSLAIGDELIVGKTFLILEKV